MEGALHAMKRWGIGLSYLIRPEVGLTCMPETEFAVESPLPSLLWAVNDQINCEHFDFRVPVKFRHVVRASGSSACGSPPRSVRSGEPPLEVFHLATRSGTREPLGRDVGSERRERRTAFLRGSAKGRRWGGSSTRRRNAWSPPLTGRT